jgi:hypothetical protein
MWNATHFLPCTRYGKEKLLRHISVGIELGLLFSPTVLIYDRKYSMKTM